MTVESNAIQRSIACCVSIVFLGCASPQTGTTTTVPNSKHQAAGDLAKPTSTAPAYSDVLDAFDAPGDSQAQTLASTVNKVTVYSDRARVTRQATTQITTKPTVYAFRKLPSWVDDGSVRVSTTAGRIVDVRVERSFLARSSDAKWRKAEDHHRLLTNKLAALSDEISVLNAQQKQIESIKAFSLDKITKDTTIGDISVKSYGDVLSFISIEPKNRCSFRTIPKRDSHPRDDEFHWTITTAGQRRSLSGWRVFGYDRY